MDDAQASAKQHGSRRRFPWILLTLVTLLAVAIVVGQQHEDLGTANLVTYAASSLIVLITAIWVAARTRLPVVIRFAPIALIVIALAVFFSFYRFAGWSGSLVPKFVRRGEAPTLRPITLANATATGDTATVQQITPTPFDFPQFLGPHRDQQITTVRLDRDWDKTPPQLVWRQGIGQGWSGFAVVADYAVTQEQRDDQEMIVCYDLKSGDVRWAHADDARFGTEQAFGGTGPRATPTIHNSRVFTVGATGILNCLELASGSRLWSRNTLEENGAENAFWGKANSPLVVDDLIVVSVGGSDGNSLVAYRQADGQRAWSGGSDVAAYASPSLAELCGIQQVLIVNQDWVTGHDAKNGRVLWHFEWPGKTDADGNNSQAHVVGDNRVFVSKGYTKGAGLFEFDAAAVRKALDTGEPTEPKTVWDKVTNRRAVLKTKLSNVCFRDGFVYGLDEEILQCVELETGKQQWKRGRYGQGQLLMIDNLLLVQTEDGRIVLVEANPKEHVELASFQAIEGEPCWNCPALAGPYLLVRNKYEAACYKLPILEAAN
jgi:outer membrane protein assembly factor BamB